MPAPGETTDADADAVFLAPAALRHPADEFGPRAQRTIARILEATRDVFLTHGYAGTTIDEIARVADVSRASFYTYFPSKREVLLAVGARVAGEGLIQTQTLVEAGRTRRGLETWVAGYFHYLDTHGSFSFAWTQAARSDEEIRVAGMKRHLQISRAFGESLATSAGRVADDPAAVGLVASSCLERSWNLARLYTDTVTEDRMVHQAALALWGLARQQAPATPA